MWGYLSTSGEKGNLSVASRETDESLVFYTFMVLSLSRLTLLREVLRVEDIF